MPLRPIDRPRAEARGLARQQPAAPLTIDSRQPGRKIMRFRATQPVGGWRAGAAALGLAVGALCIAPAALAVEISFYFPVAVSGPLTKLVESMAADFEKANPDVTVKPIYAGNYGETLTKALTANR